MAFTMAFTILRSHRTSRKLSQNLPVSLIALVTVAIHNSPFTMAFTNGIHHSAISQNLTQIVSEPTRVPDRPGDGSHSQFTIHNGIHHSAISQNLTQFVSEPTRFPDRPGDGSHLLDIFMCTNPEDYHANVLSPIGNSDHCLVSVDISFRSPVATAPPIHRTVYQYRKADWDGFQDFLNYIHWSYVLSLDPNSAAAELIK